MKKNNTFFLIASVILIACCLRAPITTVGPLTTTIQSSLGLSSAVAGLLTTLPLITFAVVSFITGPLSNKLGAGRLMLFSIIILICGLLIRSFLGTAGLFAGSVIIGLGIGVNNVLLPPVIKTTFPEKMGTLTGIYTTLMAAFASLAMGISVPVALKTSWNFAIVMWILVPILALIAWAPNSSIKLSDPAVKSNRKSVVRSPITWYITMFMSFQSILFYSFVAWFSTILQSKGYAPTTAGLLNMIMMLCGLPGSFIMPIIASKTKHQSFWGAFIGLCYTISMITTLFAEHIFPLIITMITYGFGSGAAIAFCMVLFNLHTRDAQDASSLSGFAQGIGYIMAAIGPVLIGKLIDATSSWTVPLLTLAVIGIICTIFGWFSGLDRMVDTEK